MEESISKINYSPILLYQKHALIMIIFPDVIWFYFWTTENQVFMHIFPNKIHIFTSIKKEAEPAILFSMRLRLF